MNNFPFHLPKHYESLRAKSTEIGFSMPSDERTGSLLRTLLATKPGGSFLEIGTGTGLSLSWMIDGMDPASHIVTIDNHAGYQTVAKSFFC